MAKYLSEFGWDPVILTPENPDFELRDESLLKDISPEAVVLKTPIWEPFGLYRKLMGKKAVQKQGVVDTKDASFIARLSKWIRGNWFIPDPRIFWVRPAVNFISKYLINNPVDLIITTGPPHSMHLIGMEVKRRHNLKWVADFRDPWSDWDVLPQLNLNKKSWATHKKLENQVMNQADMVLTVTKNLANRLAKTGGIDKVEVITNGFDAADFDMNTSINPSKFRISHVGLLNDGRNPELLWEVLNELCIENEVFKESLEVVLAGTIEQSVQDSISNHDSLKSRVNIPEYLSHKQVLELYQESAILLLLLNNTSNSSWILPGKLFEYLSAKKSILAIGQIESEANEVLIECGYDPFLTYDDKNTIRDRVESLYKQFLSGLDTKSSELANRYDRKKLTGDLVKLLNELVA